MNAEIESISTRVLYDLQDMLESDSNRDWVKPWNPEIKWWDIFTSGNFNSEPEVHESENFLLDAGITVSETNDGAAYYSILHDDINMPWKQAFSSYHSYYAVLFHEAIHWTGSNERLNRSGIGSKNSTPEYAREELVAEIGSMILCRKFQVPYAEQQHAYYVSRWLKGTEGDAQDNLIEATCSAMEAVEFLHRRARKGN